MNNISVKNFFATAIITTFMIKSFLIWDHFITFPQQFRISKIFGHPSLGSGGKKTVKRYLKSEQTYRHTHRHTHIWTNQLIESIGNVDALKRGLNIPPSQSLPIHPKWFGIHGYKNSSLLCRKTVQEYFRAGLLYKWSVKCHFRTGHFVVTTHLCSHACLVFWWILFRNILDFFNHTTNLFNFYYISYLKI